MLYLLQHSGVYPIRPSIEWPTMFGINRKIFYWICTNVGDALNVCCHSTFGKLYYFFILYFSLGTLWTRSSMLINASTCIWKEVVLRERKNCILCKIFWNRTNNGYCESLLPFYFLKTLLFFRYYISVVDFKGPFLSLLEIEWFAIEWVLNIRKMFLQYF